MAALSVDLPRTEHVTSEGSCTSQLQLRPIRLPRNTGVFGVDWITDKLALGEPIFTIAFQTLDEVPEEGTTDGRKESQDTMIARVRDTADSALSNALYDLYASEMEARLNEYRANTLAELERNGDKRWVQIDRMWTVLFNSWWKKAVGIVLSLSTFAAGVAGVTYVVSLFTDKF